MVPRSQVLNLTRNEARSYSPREWRSRSAACKSYAKRRYWHHIRLSSRSLIQEALDYMDEEAREMAALIADEWAEYDSWYNLYLESSWTDEYWETPDGLWRPGHMLPELSPSNYGARANAVHLR